MFENKFYKIGQSGSIYITALLYNPVTKESESVCVRDYDYDDCSRDNDELYYMPIDHAVKRQYLHDCGYIQVGDIVKVVKGRKIAIGYTGEVIKIFDYHDRYGRFVAEYVVFADGQKTNVNNCELI